MAEEEQYQLQPDFLEEIKSGDKRRAYVAARDYVAHELEGNRCPKCAMSQLRTGDTAALVLRLTQIIDAIEAIPDHSGVEDELEAIRNRRPSNRKPASPAEQHSDLGTKHAARKQQGRKQSGY